MSTPTATDLDSMDYAYLGTPFVNVESKAGQNTNSLDFAYLGQPFVGAVSGAAPVTYNTTQFFMVFQRDKYQMIQRIPMEDYSPKGQQERRLQNIPVPEDRRNSMPVFESADVHARISVLEVKVMNTDDRLEDTQKLTTKLVERLDTHIQASTMRDANMQAQLIKVSDSVMNLAATVTETNGTLKEIANMASKSHMQLMKWDTIITTVIKIASIFSITVGAFWSIYTFADSKYNDNRPAIIQPHVQGK